MSLRAIHSRVFGWRVIAGPFRGLRYVPGSVGSVLPAKLLGSYELELRPLIARLVAIRPDRIVNVGAGEGYYAVGLARRLGDCQVVAFEAEAHGRELMRQIVDLNGVAARVKICGACRSTDLQSALAGSARPVVVMDVEGAEMELLDPTHAPALRQSTVLVEIHDFAGPVADAVQRRYSGSHRLTEIATRPRTWRDLPWFVLPLAFTPLRRRLLRAMDELRPGPMRWFLLEPRA